MPKVYRNSYQKWHTFDYDKIKSHKMILRASRAGEKITTLDDKEHTLPGGDIVIEDGEQRLIDLAGIMGGKLSEVDEKTKNVLLFVQTYNPINIRRTSMKLSKKTEASSLFEKELDPELVEITIRRGIDLFIKLCGGEPEKEILDIYPSPYKTKIVHVGTEFINERLGVGLSKEEIVGILKSLGFEAARDKGDTLAVSVPSFRAQDVGISEDIVEEVARLYGYHNLPSILMPGVLPEPPDNQPFSFETKIKQILKGWGAVELYTLSLVSKEKVTLSGPGSWSLKLKNPLGGDSEYLRQSLAPSLVDAVGQNPGEKDPFHLFEMANVYLPVRAHLPEEKMMLAGIFANYNFRKAKGIIEALLGELRINAVLSPDDARGFLPNHRLSVKYGREEIGQFGVLENNLIFYELDTKLLQEASGKGSTYTPIPKYPAQIEDLALVLPSHVRAGDVTEIIKKQDKQIAEVELIDIYHDTRTFRIAYRSPNKTLTDKEVKKIRNKILGAVKKKFGVTLKS
ncbi:MAG: phenylalanine--tRNA ligase subunit beta [Candidatus Blackburnbacteria bacterium]|nr:phenylalanine--tRNA ligase subunit beta [Candidatus Blackburnbacteria bacterium]